MAKALPRGVSLMPDGKTYRARLFVNGKQHSIGNFQSKRDAEAALDIARADKARGVFVPPSEKRRQIKAEREQRAAESLDDPRTVRDLAEDWLRWQESRGLKLGSVYTYRRHLESKFLPTYGDRSISTITALELSDWLDALEQDKGASSAAQVHRVIAAVFKYATGDSPDLPRSFVPWMLTSPVPPLAARRLRRPHHVQRNREILTDQEIVALAGHMPERECLAVLLSGWAGLRIGEVLTLRRRHVEQDNDGVTWLTVAAQVQARGSGVREDTPKSEAGHRTIPVPPVIVPALEKHLEDHAAPSRDGLLFHAAASPSNLMNPNTLRKHFNIARDKIGEGRMAGPLDHFTWHGLRHTALTRLRQAGATTAELKAYAGHSDGKSAEIYQHAERRRLAQLTGAFSTTASEDK